MNTTFDPDEAPPEYVPPRDEPRASSPVRQRMGRNNRARGAKAERELVRLFEDEGWIVETQSGPNRRDFLAKRVVKDTILFYSVECKSLTKRWPFPGEVRLAWEQARRQAREHDALLVFCLRSQGKPTEWRRYTLEGYEDLKGWLR